MHKDTVEQFRALEALRAGVPNRDAVRQLKPIQADIEDRFSALLEGTEQGWTDEKQSPGMLIEGSFGTGKSHWLEYFQHEALERGYICSSIVLNKETPFYDLLKVYRGCVEAAVAPDKTGPALTEIALTFDVNKAPHYRELFQWVNQNKDLDPRLAATLLLFERMIDEESREMILNEWMGYPMYVNVLKKALKDIGEAKTYRIGKPLQSKTIQRFEFLSRFFYAAGYKGWVVLLDETEMISKYTLRQRGKAYAHLAQLMGLVKGVTIPGLAAVFTITADYDGEVLHGRKNDIINIPGKLEGTKEEEFVAPALTGMKAIEKQARQLRPPSREHLLEVYRRVSELYGSAYQWDTPNISTMLEYSDTTARMRQYIRFWINTWDLRRLYNYQADVLVEEVKTSYEEDPDFQREAEAVEEEEEAYTTV